MFVLGYALANLNQSMLDMAGMFFVMQVFVDLFVREVPPKPRIPPEEERHEHDQPCREEEQQTLPRSHAVTWLCCALGRFVDLIG